MVESGMDAWTHGLEAYINKNADDFTKTMARGAVEGLLKYLRQSFESGDIDSRQHVHNFPAWPGLVFRMLAWGWIAVLPMPLGPFWHQPWAPNAIALPYVLEYNQQTPRWLEISERLSRLIDKKYHRRN